MISENSFDGKTLPPRLLCPLSGISHKEIMLPVRKWTSCISGLHSATKLYLKCHECGTRVYLGKDWRSLVSDE